MGVIYFIIFACYALAFWYGSKLVREEEHYTAGVMLTVRFSFVIDLRLKNPYRFSWLLSLGRSVWAMLLLT